MNKIYLYIVIGLSIFSFNSCDYLDQKPGDILSVEDTYKTRDGALSHLAAVYSSMPADFEQRWTPGGRNYTAGAWVAGCDEAEYVFDFNGAHVINNGSINPETGFVYDYWSRWYKGIKTASAFIEDLSLCKELEPGDFKQWTAEARAVRAVYYYYLLRLYGPIPILKEPFTEQSSIGELNVARNTVEEVGEYIITELELAIEEGLISNIKTSGKLNNDVTHLSGDKGLGHIDIPIAKAMIVQTRMLLASPLFTGENNFFASLENNDGTKLFPQYSEAEKQSLWKKAADSAKNFIDTYVGTNSGYDLTRKYTSDGQLDPYLSYREAVRGATSDLNNIVTGEGVETSSTVEMIWFNKQGNSSTMHYDRTPKHVGEHRDVQCSSGLGATQNIVDQYFMANGIKPILGYTSDGQTPIINDESGYEDTGFLTEDYKDPISGRVLAPKGVHKSWANREPRFYADITFDGQKWLYNPGGDIYTYLQYSGNSGVGQGNSNDYSKTGYVVRKSAPIGNWGNNDRVSIMLRLAQIYLDYAEALNEYNPNHPDILKYLNLIRERAGLPQYGKDGFPIPNDIRQAIRDERRVELAFEGVRFFDVRRWNIAHETENKPIYGLSIMDDGDDFFSRTKVEDRFFTMKNYFFPLPMRDLVISDNLKQNPGW